MVSRTKSRFNLYSKKDLFGKFHKKVKECSTEEDNEINRRISKNNSVKTTMKGRQCKEKKEGRK